jgi:transcriptional regulator with XRE-family HTH domain
MADLGEALRRVRQAAGTSLTRAAAAAGVTKGYLSKLEAGTATPSIAVLSSLAAVYGIATSELFKNGEESGGFALVRAGERQPVNRHGTELGYIFEAVSIRKRNPLAEAFFLTLPPLEPGSPHARYHHSGEEILLALEGRIRMFYGGAEYMLEPGDCVQFDAAIEHRAEAADDSVAKAFIAIVSAGPEAPSYSAPKHSKPAVSKPRKPRMKSRMETRAKTTRKRS